MSWLAVAAITVGTIATGYSIYSGERANSMQKKAQDQAVDTAQKQEKANDEAVNRANQKTPDTSGILSSAQQASKTGASGTMLTGPTGIDQSMLQLGRKSLLGS